MKNYKYNFPLIITRELVAFPKYPVSISAIRSITVNAIKDAQEKNTLVILVTQKSADIDNPTVKDIYNVGTVCEIAGIDTIHGNMRVRLNPQFRLNIKEVSFFDGFYIGRGSDLKNVFGDIKEENKLANQVIKLLETSEKVIDLPKNVIDKFAKGVNAIDLVDMLANYYDFSVELKQKILETPEVNERLLLLIDALSNKEIDNEIEETITRKVRESSDQNQRDYLLREKLKAIRSELGEDVDDEKSTDAILEKLDKEPYPENIKEKVKSEIKRYRSLPQASLEASLSKNYIDTLMALPWYQKTVDNDDLNNVAKILNEDHYGLEKVKQRIIEYLAVKKMTNSLKSPILCFYGPPGVGKTSLGHSIARALGRKFFKVALGGISDESEIRGHRRTYVGAMPGRILAGMKKCGVTNPVFLLDEIDKLTSNIHGDPSSALLEVLDPEQNYAFNDNYLEEPYDLSDVLFIATANYIENVPGPLRDRLELIEVNSYTEIDKIHIAKEHLIKKQVELNGLKQNQISFTNDALRYIISHYTREAGARELERKIAAICRRAVVELLTNSEIKKIKVDVKKVREYLGIEIFEDTEKDKVDQVGVVTGLAYTQYGGCILPIEVNTFPGKGRLVLTGKLGDVMKESATIALDYVRANATKYHIDQDIFETQDTHIHVPEGAVPKDGPSAGIAITTAIISCYSKIPVDSSVAMTGEVTLRGNALPIGGLKEKSLAALRSGIKTIIVPRKNHNNVEELPNEVKETLNIVYMDSVDDALKVALRG